MIISSKDHLEKAALDYGVLPFFRNGIQGFSVEEMSAPGMLFGGDSDEDGCWEWKGPVIREMTTAYGKFFNKKAGFVSLDLFPDFLNYRRAKYPLKNETDHEILQVIKLNEGLTSTELKKKIFGVPNKNRQSFDLIDSTEYVKPKRHGLEGSLQRLQMGCHILIADFEYKYTRSGTRYGWGVALYSTPEMWFERGFKIDRSPEESFEILTSTLYRKLHGVGLKEIEKLLS